MSDLNERPREVEHARERAKGVEYFTPLLARHGVPLHERNRLQDVGPRALERPPGEHFRVHRSAPFTLLDEKIALRERVLGDQVRNARVNRHDLNPERLPAKSGSCL